MNETDLGIRLYGTEEAVPPPRLLQAGRLTAELEDGQLRHIRVDGTEAIRAISFLVRDRDWGTYPAAITQLSVQQEADSFTVSYEADVGDSAQALHYSARIHGTPAGLRFECEGQALSPFVTNRTGFVVLHPIQGVAGAPVRIEHVDGRIEDSQFPRLINPVQPMMQLRALSHEALPGVTVECRMEGDTFEMEDQRNWTDASYKTYVRPLALPWPYTLAPTERLKQSVTLQVTGELPVVRGLADRSILLSLGEPAAPLPSLGFGLQPGESLAASTVLPALRALAPARILCHYDARKPDAVALLKADVAFARSLGAELWLEAVMVQVAEIEAEVQALGALSAAMGQPFSTVLLSPASDLRGTLPGSPWPPAPPADLLYRAARVALPGVRIGGGMFSFFTELNRKRPPLQDLDLVSFTTSALVHAGDDITVIENLEALPQVMESARAIAGDRPLAVGPSAIGMRLNPYGEAPKSNPANIRQAMNFNDPRQRGLLGAAWALGYCAAAATGGAQSIALGSLVGAHGLVHVPCDWPQPFYDEQGGVYPQFHLARAWSRLAGLPTLTVNLGGATNLAAIAVSTEAGLELLLANLSAQALTVQLPGAIQGLRVLDAESFSAAAADPCWLDPLDPSSSGQVQLGAFALARLLLTHSATR